MTVGYGLWKRSKVNIEASVPIAFRMTGGGVVHHHGDLIYSVVAPVSCHRTFGQASESYQAIHRLLCETLRTFGYPAELYQSCGHEEHHRNCFENPVKYDVMMDGVKIAGAGQKRSFGYLLHQGAIAWEALLERDPNIDLTRFQTSFAERLASFLKCEVKETSWSVDELGMIKQSVSYGFAGTSP